jgi:hypothetical protein
MFPAEQRLPLLVKPRADNEEDIMRNTLLITTAMAALIGTAGIASAQAPNNAPAATQSAPSGMQGAPAEKTAPMNRGDSSGNMKGGQAEMPREGGNAQRTQDNTRDNMKSKGAETTQDQKGKAASDTTLDKSKDGMKTGQKNAAEGKAGTTTGQAGAGAKLTGEQRTTIRTSITRQNVKPVTNINFSVSIGTRVPRTVGFHPLPAEVVTIYPDWRGYEFFLVNDQVVVVNPRTLEIVAVLDA